MSFRQFGGLNFAAKHNAVSSNYNTSNNLQVTKNVGQVNSYINFLSDISGNNQKCCSVGTTDASINIYLSGTGLYSAISSNTVTLNVDSNLNFINYIDNNLGTINVGTQSRSINIGSPTAPMSIKGSTLGLFGTTVINGPLGVSGATTLNNALGVSGATTLNGALSVYGASKIYNSSTSSNYTLDVSGTYPFRVTYPGNSSTFIPYGTLSTGRDYGIALTTGPTN